MGWLLGLPLKLLSLLGGILMVVLRFALPVLIGVGAAMLLRRYRRGKTDEEAVSWKNRKSRPLTVRCTRWTIRRCSRYPTCRTGRCPLDIRRFGWRRRRRIRSR